jgi:hypothetical protein
MLSEQAENLIRRNGGPPNHTMVMIVPFVVQLMNEVKATFRREFDLHLRKFEHTPVSDAPVLSAIPGSTRETPGMAGNTVRGRGSAGSASGRDPGGRRLGGHSALPGPSAEQGESRVQHQQHPRPPRIPARENSRAVPLSSSAAARSRPRAVHPLHQWRSAGHMTNPSLNVPVACEQQSWGVSIPPSPVASATPVRYSNFDQNMAPLLMYAPGGQHSVSTPQQGPSTATNYTAAEVARTSPFDGFVPQQGHFSPSGLLETSQQDQQPSPPFGTQPGGPYGQPGFTLGPWPPNLNGNNPFPPAG